MNAKKPKPAFLHGIDEEDDEKSKVVQDKEDNKSNFHQERSTEKPKDNDEKYLASTSTGRRNGYGIPTISKSKLKNPKPSKRMEKTKPFKGIAYCW